jgi:chitin disaccharide deacetylase
MCAFRGLSPAVIVIADDFGMSSAINCAIAESFARGLISGASIMANQVGTKEAAAMARSVGVTHLIGLHFVLTDGEPLTDDIRGCRQFCDGDGCFYNWRRKGPLVHLPSTVRNALANEFRAQVYRIRDEGIPISHIDGHHHVHTEPAISKLLVPLAQQLRLGRVRLGRNSGNGRTPINRCYKWLFNRSLRRAGLAGTRHFGSVSDFAESSGRYLARRRWDFEVMVHPVLDAQNRVVDAGAPNEELATLLLRNRIIAV